MTPTVGQTLTNLMNAPACRVGVILCELTILQLFFQKKRQSMANRYTLVRKLTLGAYLLNYLFYKTYFIDARLCTYWLKELFVYLIYFLNLFILLSCWNTWVCTSCLVLSRVEAETLQESKGWKVSVCGVPVWPGAGPCNRSRERRPRMIVPV